MVAYWKKLVMKFLSHWVFPGKVLTRQCRSRLTHRSSVNYDIQTDDQQYGFKIFCQASGGACHQYRPFHTVLFFLRPEIEIINRLQRSWQQELHPHQYQPPCEVSFSDCRVLTGFLHGLAAAALINNKIIKSAQSYTSRSRNQKKRHCFTTKRALPFIQSLPNWKTVMLSISGALRFQFSRTHRDRLDRFVLLKVKSAYLSRGPFRQRPMLQHIFRCGSRRVVVCRESLFGGADPNSPAQPKLDGSGGRFSEMEESEPE
ncbi:receptor kinase 3 [Prunus dulcis]|uniref:Receptor kinase 3 n=1 Tax=Prunus dulcis TaxID=3755 RepID=A0A4Y1RD96_PRUDU|nr:receptor kinase 3 [Prunus dulcis]